MSIPKNMQPNVILQTYYCYTKEHKVKYQFLLKTDGYIIVGRALNSEKTAYKNLKNKILKCRKNQYL